MTGTSGTSSRRSPVLAVMSTLAALQVLVGGAALIDILGAKGAGVAVLAVAAIQTGVQFYVRGQVTPTDTVVAQRTDAGVVVAGPSAQAPTGVQVEEPIAVQAPPQDVGGQVSPNDSGHADLFLVMAITVGVFLGGLILHLVLT